MAVFIGMNLSNLCSFWLFKTFVNLPVSVLALIAFAAGIVTSLLIILIAHLKKTNKEKRLEDALLTKNNIQEKIKKIEKKAEKQKKEKRRFFKKLQKNNKSSQPLSETESNTEN